MPKKITDETRDQIMDMVTSGHSRREICTALCISETTVDTVKLACRLAAEGDSSKFNELAANNKTLGRFAQSYALRHNNIQAGIKSAEEPDHPASAISQNERVDEKDYKFEYQDLIRRLFVNYLLSDDPGIIHQLICDLDLETAYDEWVYHLPEV